MFKRALVIMLFSVVGSIAHAEPIVVSFVYAEDSGLSPSNKLTLLIQAEELVNAGLVNSGLGHLQVEFRNSGLNVQFDAQSKNPGQIINKMVSENSNPLSYLSLDRNKGVGSDLVILWTPNFTERGPGEAFDGFCGASPVVPLSVLETRREINAFSVINGQDPECLPGYPQHLTHEFGHLLYAEHQASVDDNNDVAKPANFNHGISGSIMETNNLITTTPMNYRFSGSPGLSSDLALANVKRFINEESWNPVSRYRLPAPPQPSLSVNWINGNCFNSIFEVTVSLPSGSGTDNCNVYSVTVGGSIISTLYSASFPSCIVSNLADGSYYSAQCSNGGNVGEMSEIEDANIPGCTAGPGSGGWNGW